MRELKFKKHIFIPTYRRAHAFLRNTATLPTIIRGITPENRDEYTVSIVVRFEELEAYEHALKESSLSEEARSMIGICIIPSEVYKDNPDFAWSDTMDYIIDATRRLGYACFAIMDDDLTLYTRRKNEYNQTVYDKLYDLDHHATEAFLHDLFEASKIIPIVGILPRQFSQDIPFHPIHNTRIMQLFCFWGPTIWGMDSWFHGPKFAGDIWFSLKCFKNRIPNVVLTNYVRNDVPNTPGGVSECSRTPEEHLKSLMIIKKEFPEWVKVVQKPESASGNWKGGFCTVRISWKDIREYMSAG